MRSKCKLLGVVFAIGILPWTISGVGAAYTFDGVPETGYYPSTNYEDIYGAQYNYGSRNVADEQIPKLEYGVYSSTSIGIMEQNGPPVQAASSGGFAIDMGGVGSEILIGNSGTTLMPDSDRSDAFLFRSAYTDVSGMEQTDGSIGTIEIPSLHMTRKVWEGETSDSMAKGIAHYRSTSAWDGNVGLCSHNRGTAYAIGEVKNLKVGDTIIYSTVYGTRTYQVSLVETIANTDWSYLQGTADNRLTITTCLADHPESRICVQAIEAVS